MNKEAVLSRIRKERVVALIRAGSSAGLLDCAKALAEGGLSGIELTMTTPGALAALEKAAAAFPDFLFGLGTVIDAETARAGIAAGARFLVTPAHRPEVIAVAQAAGVAVFGGAFTPTEVLASWEAGADAVKVFPVEALGPGYIKALRAPFPQIPLFPTGGIDAGNIAAYLRAGAVAVAAGGSLVSETALREKDWAGITAKARALRDAAAAAS